jgi:hypothetical protein
MTTDWDWIFLLVVIANLFALALVLLRLAGWP